MKVRVLLYSPGLALPGITIARLPVSVVPGSAVKSHSPWPLPAGAFSIVAGVVLSVCGELAVGPMLAGLPGAAVAVAGVSVMVAPVPAAAVLPLTVGAVAETVTL